MSNAMISIDIKNKFINICKMDILFSVLTHFECNLADNKLKIKFINLKITLKIYHLKFFDFFRKIT